LTKAEHSKAYRAARSVTARQVIEGKRKIRHEYVRIVTRIANVIRKNQSKLFLEEQIKSAFPRKELFTCLMSLIVNGRANVARLVADIEKRYIFEALDKTPGHGLSKEKITAMFERKIELTKIANSKPYYNVVKNAPEKTYTFHQSYSLSKSVWDTVNQTEKQILDVVRGGISQGRDIKKISADLMAYIQGGSQVIPGRWGKLETGTREYVRRLGKTGIDYRAMRLYRSEKYRSLQEAAVEDGQSNPACTGEYDWILMPGRGTWNCDCPDIAAAGPYKADNIPPYPHTRHPNCDCLVEPRLKDHDEFIQQLRDYVHGEDTPGAHEIEKWALENNLKDETYKYSESPGARDGYKDEPNDDGAIREQLVNEMSERSVIADFNESAKETIIYIPALHDRISNDIPEIKEMLQEIKYTSLKTILDNTQGSGYSTTFKLINYNKLIFKSKENLKNYIRKNTGWFSSNSLSSVIAHEYGHILYNLIKQKLGYTDEKMETLLNSLLYKYGIVSDKQMANEISGYSVDRFELISEVVSEVHTRKKPRQHSQNIYNALLLILRN
jgi:hypothetical protein